MRERSTHCADRVAYHLFYFAGGIDALYSKMFINTVYMMPIALLVFIPALSLLLSIFFMRAFAMAPNEAAINREQNITINR